MSVLRSTPARPTVWWASPDRANPPSAAACLLYTSMADVKKIATRDSYGNTLKELAAEGHDDLVVLDADLAAATKTGMFQKAYPDRHFDCGIAEGNMVGVAAGLAAMGYVPFVSSFAMFAAGRAFEQVRNSVGYPHLNVKIGATHGGISVGEDGASHQCCEDFALMRSIPGMTVICPADDIEARAAVRAAYAMEGPVYLRFGRLAVPVFHDEANYHFELGKGEQLTEGNDIAIIATGLMVNEARMAAEQLAAEGIHARVINIPTIRPLDEEIEMCIRDRRRCTPQRSFIRCCRTRSAASSRCGSRPNAPPSRR